jgi:hypothetical protein
MSFPDDQLDLNLMMSRRAFPVAQAAFEGAVLRTAAANAVIGFHGSDTSAETGAVALVREDGDHVDLVGEIVRVSRRLSGETRTVLVYVFGTGPILDDLSLTRRGFMGLGILAAETLECSIEVIA